MSSAHYITRFYITPIIYNQDPIIYNRDPIIYNRDPIIYNKKKETTRLYIIGKKEKQDYI